MNVKYAKKAVKNQVIKADHLIEYIKKSNSEAGKGGYSDKQMLELAQFYLNLHTENKSDYLAKYKTILPQQSESTIEKTPINKSLTQIISVEKPINKANTISDIRKDLKLIA